MYTALLFLHIAAGFTALGLGLAAALTRKGTRPHLSAGRGFVYAMYAVGVSALLMTALKPNTFLMAIGLFTLYMTYSGRQAIVYFRLREAHVPGLRDKLPVYAAFCVALFMVAWPLYHILALGARGVPVLLVFGLIMLAQTLGDLRSLRNPAHFTPRNRRWLLRHIGMISGAYIATCTAFLVVNVTFSPGWVPWLAPTLVGTVFIAVNTRIWRRKLSGARR